LDKSVRTWKEKQPSADDEKNPHLPFTVAEGIFAYLSAAR
jgi:hypothetical protein